MQTIRNMRESSGMSMKRFAEYFGIPYRTVQNWEAGVNKCPEYLLKLLEYKLKREGLIKTVIYGLDGTVYTQDDDKQGWTGE